MSRADRFLKACRLQPVDSTPVWIMRQAGRYLKEYRAVREKFPFLKMCKTPELAGEVTLMPVKLLKVDAAILFSDILVPLEGMGLELDFTPGPKFASPVRSRKAIKALGRPDPNKDTGYVMEAIRIIRRELAGKVPLIGFCGAPFTLATYAIEGGSSANFIESKQMMFLEPRMMHDLLEKITVTIIDYLKAQIEAGAQAVQIFDTWAGILSPRDYLEFAHPYTKRIIESVAGGEVPVIYYVNGGSVMLKRMKDAGSDVIGVDWRIKLDEARELLGEDVAVQGNLDPVALFSSPERVVEKVKEIIDENAGRPGHIFNLGHGVLPATPVDNVKLLVETVHEYSKKRRGR